MRLVSVQEMRSLEAAILAQGEDSEATLIERAGMSAARYAEERFGPLAGRPLAVICGKGHNAADGLVAARYLSAAGAKVLACLSLGRAALVPLAAEALLRAEAAGVQALDAPDLSAALDAWSPALCIDALVGIGARLPLQGPLAQAVRELNLRTEPVLSLDLPSGLDADSGKATEPCVQARATVTFIAAKLGLLLPPGAGRVGDLRVEALGIPASLLERSSQSEAFDLARARQCLPTRSWDSHKKKAQVLVLAGSERYPGAALLCARAAYRAGAGLLRVALPASLVAQAMALLPEAVPLALPGAHAREEDLAALLDQASGVQAVIVGPGLGAEPGTLALTRALWAALGCPAVFDADALQPGLWQQPAAGPRILTPHEGELSRLLGPEALRAGRLAAVKALAQASGAVALLKGPATLVAEPKGRLAVNTVGSQVLASAGSGDVLAGAIGSLLAQGALPYEAACLGAWAHGLAGQFWAQENSGRGLLASDLADLLPKALAHAGA